MRSRVMTPVWLLLAVVLAAPACRTAAVAAGGAAAGIYLTSQGASSIVEGSIGDVDQRTRAVLSEMGIRVTNREVADAGRVIEYKGETDEHDVTVELERRSASTTLVQVSARESAVEWDKSYARSIIERIVQRG